MPMAWLGRWLAQREQRVLRLMEGTQGFPRWTGSVSVNGREIPTAVAHDWIAGRPFKPSLMVNDQFFPALQSMIEKLHAHDIAYVDMSKWGNILVGDDGGPYLLDYQIHFRLPRGWPLRWWLRLLQWADMYYFRRHWLRCRPDQVSWDDRMAWSRQPPHVWIAETVGPVFRFARRVVLRMFGAKGDPRKPHSEGAEPRFPGRSD